MILVQHQKLMYMLITKGQIMGNFHLNIGGRIFGIITNHYKVIILLREAQTQ